MRALTEGTTPAELKTKLYLIDHVVDTPLVDDFRTFVARIVERALRGDWLDALLEQFAGDSNRRLAAVAAEIREALTALGEEAIFTGDAMDELIRLVGAAGVGKEQLIALYSRVRSVGTPDDIWKGLADFHATLVYRLSVIAGPARRPPLVVFARLLADTTQDRETRDALEAWSRRYLDEWKLTPPAGGPPHQRGRVHTHMIAVVRPQDPAGNEAGLVLNAWVSQEAEGDATWMHERSRRIARAEPIDEASLESRILSLVSRAAPELEESGSRMTINLFLPVALFRCTADQWALGKRKMQPVPLGSRYLVILRPWERNYDPEWIEERLEWRQLWDERHSRKGASRLCERKLFERYRAHRISRAALAFVPEREDFGPEGPLMLVVSSGTPISLWLRSGGAGTEKRFRSLLKRLVGPLYSDWREEVFALRSKAAISGDGLGSELALLWDNPDHRPIDAPQMHELEEPPHADKE